MGKETKSGHSASVLNTGAPPSRAQRVRILLTLLSFLIYAANLFLLPEARDAAFAVERSSVAAAVSNAAYGAQFGTVYSEVLEQFLRHIDAPLQRDLEGTAESGAPRGEVMKTIHDGYGVGYVVVATIAFRLFGLHFWSLPLMMLCLMALSAIAFLWRFGDDAADIAILYFSALTAMLFTTLVWDPAISLQISIGGIRFFSLVAILPAFHLLFDIIDRPTVGPNGGGRNDFLLGAQTVILVSAVLVRGSAATMIGAIGWCG